MDRLRISHAHFALGRVYVHVHLVRIHLEKQAVAGLARPVKNVLVSHPNAMRQNLISNKSAVDIEILTIRAASRGSRKTHPAVKTQRRRLNIQCSVSVSKISRHQARQTFFNGRGRKIDNRFSVCDKQKGNFRISQRNTFNHRLAMSSFRAFALQKLAACRSLVKEVRHFNACALISGGSGYLSVGNAERIFTGNSGNHFHVGDARDRGKSFAAEPKRAHTFQFIQVGNLARCMALYSQSKLIFGNTAAVI